MKFKKKIVFHPAYDKRNDEQNYGIHSVECKFYLVGERGVVQFIFYTNWNLPNVQNEIDNKNLKSFFHEEKYLEHILKWDYHPCATDIGYHSPVPMYKGHKKIKTKCEFYKNCYYDGSSLDAQHFLDVLIREGNKGVWREMKKYYKTKFKDTNENENPGLKLSRPFTAMGEKG